MKQILFLCLIFILTISITYALETKRERNQTKEIIGFHDVYSDDDVDTSGGQIATADTAYAQISAVDEIELVSSSDTDTSPTHIITVTGLDANGKRQTESITLTGTTVVASTNTWTAIESAYMNILPTGDITIRKESDNTFITQILASTRQTTDAVRFAGEYDMYITNITYGTSTSTGDIVFETRRWGTVAELITGTYYEVIDYCAVAKWSTAAANDVPHPFPSALKIPAGGAITIHGVGGTNNSDAYVTLDGYYITPGQ